MRFFFRSLIPDLGATFVRGWNPLWHLAAIGLTALCVTSGFDWYYHLLFRGTVLYPLAFTAGAVGFLIPLILPVVFWIVGALRRDRGVSMTGFAIAQAELVGLLVSYIYKAFTGRAHPDIAGIAPLVDATRDFAFGFLERGIFWGWPSSHTAVAFAMAMALVVLYRNRPVIIGFALAYAVYIGLGASMTFHWFSDALAGAIMGSLAGIAAGRTYRERRSAIAALDDAYRMQE